jgi:hypothetical protein
MRLAEASCAAPRLVWLVRGSRQGAQSCKSVHVIPTGEPFIGAGPRQRPERSVFRQPSIGHEVVFLQLALLLIDENPHALKRGGDNFLSGHSFPRLKYVNLYYASIRVRRKKPCAASPDIFFPADRSRPFRLGGAPSFPQYPPHELQERTILAARIQLADFDTSQAENGAQFVMRAQQIRLFHVIDIVPAGRILSRFFLTVTADLGSGRTRSDRSVAGGTSSLRSPTGDTGASNRPLS